ncbi:MAG: LuxR family transcriptional [Planctomycetota bacterium]|nr:MAG: LuxR family transcriptional [Planctomycetota bacterium]
MGSTIVLADHVAADRAAFQAALAGEPYRIVAEAERGDQMVEIADRNRPWLVAIAIDLPREGAGPAIKALLAKRPEMKVLVLHRVEHASNVPRVLADGGSARLMKPFTRESLLAVLKTVNAASVAPRSADSRLIQRIKKVMPVSYKGVEEGFFAKKREAMVVEFSAITVVMHAEEKLGVGKDIHAEIQVPGEAALKAKLHVNRAEPVPGMGRFEITLSFADMAPAERDRLRLIVQRMTEKKSSVPR